MAWKLLPTDYTDAVWSGLKRYTQVDNSDGTVSFNDVTTYTNKEKSFFGAKDANRIYNGTCSDARWSSWGNGADRVNRLKQAGYDPSEVQSEVNKLF